MPESTVSTPGSDAAKRSAQAASGSSGAALRSTAAASSGSFTSEPPFTGSITTTGRLRARAAS